MTLKLVVCTALLATAAVASAQTRPAVGTVYYKNATDCADMKDGNGTPVCVMNSLGGPWIMDAPYRTVTSLRLPYGRYSIDAKVLDYIGSARPVNPWVVVECLLEDANHTFIDFSAYDYGSHIEASGSFDYLFTGQSAGSTTVLSGVLDVRSPAGATVNLNCRVQGQGMAQNADGSWYWGAPIKDVRFHNVRMRAISVPAINIR